MLARQIPRLVVAAAGALLLGGCETVSLDTPTPRPAPVEPAVQASVPPNRVDLRPRPAAAPEPEPLAQAQPLGAEPFHVQPLVPQGSQPAAAPAPAPAPAPASAPIAPPPAPPAAASTPAAPPAGVRYVCNDRTAFMATFGDVSVTLHTALGVIRLEQTVAADGARYANGEVAVWFKGREAHISNLAEPGAEVLCVEQR